MCSKPPLATNPNPNPDPSTKKKHVLHIGGIPVEFPYKPYGSQLAFMGRVIATLDRAQKEGRSHALLESPTGTGKSLSLLCSALAWQQNQRSKSLFGNYAYSKPDPEAFVDPLGHGGGFIPEVEPSGNAMPSPSMMDNLKQKKVTSPTIYYATRTHSQITQVIREFRKTGYRVPMAVLASRKHYCTNPYVRGQENIDEKCKLLLKERRKIDCPQFLNVNAIRTHPSLQKGGCYEVHDIEDLLKVGQMVEGCSYFAARAMAGVAQIVFCPYSYIINPLIRKAMEVDIKGDIIIFDEAHNIEDITRDAGSIDIEENALVELRKELETLCFSHDADGILSWMRQRRNTLAKHDFQHYASCWTADKAVKELQEANISQQYFPILRECAASAIRIASEADPDVPHLSGMSCTVLEGLFASLDYFFSGNGEHICDYQLVLQRFIKRDADRKTVVKREAGIPADDTPCTFSLWCLNPAVVFKEIADTSLSVILTSGTLSPMSSFESELGVQFGTCLEAPHVINVESQLWAGVIHNGPGNYPLNASYRTAEAYDFQDALGTSLEEIFRVVPGGCLVFFPSYKLMEKLRNRWSETGQWPRLNAQKPIFIEPRGGQDEFEPVLKDYYDTIRQGNRPAVGMKRRGKKLNANNHNATESKENSKKGATFLAVCRGKVSEGIDFSDENARAVIIVGIPFPNIFDIQVAEKKKYNDTYKSSKRLLSGNEWYCQQAFRALNQAAGRCIRHRLDYGAIIFLDERFCKERNLTYISKWIRKSIRQHENFDQSLEGLKSFFKDVKVENSANIIHPVDVEAIDMEDEKNGFTEKKMQKLMDPVWNVQKPVSNGVDQSFEVEDSANVIHPVGVEANVEGERNGSCEKKIQKIMYPIWNVQKPVSNGVDQSLKGLKSFKVVKVENGANVIHHVNVEAIDLEDERNGSSEKKIQKITDPIWNVQKHVSNGVDQSLEGLKSFKDVKVEAGANVIHIVDVEATNVEDERNGSTKKKMWKIMDPIWNVQKPVSNVVEEPANTTTWCKAATAMIKHDRSPPLKSPKVYAARLINKRDRKDSMAYVDLDCDLEKDNRCFLSPPRISSPNDIELSVVKESPDRFDSVGITRTLPGTDHGPSIVKETTIKDGSILITNHESVSENDFSNSSIIQTSSLSSPSSTSGPEYTHLFVTPKKECMSHKGSSLDLSVNSHIHKRRKSSGSLLVNHLKIEQLDSPDPKTPNPGGFMEGSITTADTNFSGGEIMNFCVRQSRIAEISETSATNADIIEKSVHIFCSLCRSPLGLAENSYIVPCSLTSSSKAHLVSLWRGKLETPATVPTSVSIVVCDNSAVDQRIWGRTPEGDSGQGIWSKVDGCVFNTSFCPFCSNQDNCLGLHVLATDSSNVQFLNKVLFYSDRLEIKDIEASMKKEVSPSSVTSGHRSVVQDPFEKFTYIPQQSNQGEWRTTKSKMRLPRKGLLSTAKR